jgi:glutamate racemase
LNLGDYGTVVLGCTHFPFYKDSFRKLLPEGVDIIDGSCGTVRNLRRILQDRGYSSGVKGSIEYYSSGVRAEENSCLKRYDRLLDRLRELDR